MTLPPAPRDRESEAPSAAEPPEATSEDEDDSRPHARADEGRPGLERILPELIRKGFEAGRERMSESMFPKDIASHLVSQLGDIRSGVVKAVAQEVGRFLREADIASEVRKVLTGLDIDAHVKLRFKARDGGAIKPEIEIDLDGDPNDKPRGSERRKR